MSATARFAAGIIALIAAVLSHGETAHAQTAQQLDWCDGKDNATPELTISGCTAVIQSGKFTGKNLSLAFVLRGKAHRADGNADKALADFDRAIKLDSKNVGAWVERCSSNIRNDPGRAIQDCTSAIKLDSKNASAWAYRGDAFSGKFDYDSAIKDYNEAIKLSPDWMWPRNDRGWGYQIRAEYDRAIADYTDVIRLAPTYPIG
jgi:tetratricopeptide (TPR) repeat protein